MGSMIAYLRQPLFWVGLLIRFALLVLVAPQAASSWYVPFLTYSVSSPSLDPWTGFIAAGGDPRAFPYGYVMWVAFMPFTVMSVLLQVPVYLGYGLTLLVTDIVVLWLLRTITRAELRQLLLLYWLSPITLFATYWLGLNDLIPVALILGGLVLLLREHPARAGAVGALAISAKLSMVLTIPFVLFYLIHNKRLRPFIRPSILAGCIAFLLVWVPHMLSLGGRVMLFSNPELAKVLDVSLPLGGNKIYLTPLIYGLVLFGAWRVRRMSFELLLVLLGIAFFVVLLFTPAAAGWYVWVVPFLVIYQLQGDRIARGFVACFSLLYVTLALVMAPIPGTLPWHAAGSMEYLSLPWITPSAIHTVLIAVGLILSARMLREGVQANEYYRLSRRPFVLGIAGNMGSGKETLAATMKGLFGGHSVVQLSGDSYRLWDRNRPMWQLVTELNPRASDLSRMTEDVLALSRGRRVSVARYNKKTGQKGIAEPLASNDFIIVTSIHALYQPLMRQACDVTIYLDTDEALRCISQREVSGDGRDDCTNVTDEPCRRDATRFVSPQEQHADLVLALQPLRPDLLDSGDRPLRMKLGVRTRHGMYYEDLIRALIGVCGLHVDVNMESPNNRLELIIEGEATADDVALAAKRLLPHIGDLLDLHPAWRDGMLGVMQLIVLVHIAQSLRTRL